MKINFLVYTLILTGVFGISHAQIQEHSLRFNPELQKPNPSQVKVRSHQVLSLPFADDFSGPTGAPNPEFWEDAQAFVNQSLGLNPPSIGVVTLDGLNEKGLPYGGGYGGSDTLTSRPIDLAGENLAYLSFYVQPKGIGYLPQTRDSLIVEGKTEEGLWKRLESFEGLDDSYINLPAPEFQRVSIPLTSDFLHANFQFRFRNYSNNRGLESLWHLDYIMVTRQAPDLYIEDIAFTAPPAYLVKRYKAFPLSHIVLDPDRLNSELPIHIRNNSRDRFTIDTSRVEIYNPIDRFSIFTDESLLEIPPIVDENQRNINPGSVYFVNTFNTTSIANYLTQTDDEKVTLTTEYEYVMRAENQLPTFRTNNKVTTHTRFENFFAYDDNSVEGSISTYNGNGITTRIAVEFELLQTDTLQSIRILFPYLIENYESKLFNLLIFVGDLKEKADYTLYNLQPVRGDHFQPFTEYIITDHIPEGIEIPAGKFYIGWEHPRGTSRDYIPFGFDKNYPEANQYIYYNVGGDWLNVASVSPNLQGAIALRPVVGQKTVLTSNTPEIIDLSGIIFPNPTRSVLHFQPRYLTSDANYTIYNTLGRMLASGVIRAGETTINVSPLPSGQYFLVISPREWKTQGHFRFIKH
ncbi:MAG TPA: T9SS type A sorting domain-containing protein [Membranihabitans sp.]|nr:T9SS type A sorting domain-containing protein [Membranihabitans sp.]